MITSSERVKNNLVTIAILLVGFLAFALYVYADTTSTTVTVGNATPTIGDGNVTLLGPSITGNDFVMTENSFVWATSSVLVSDNNGCDTITSVTATLYLASTSNAGTSCTYDDSTCYTASSCIATTTSGLNMCDGGVDTSGYYDCGFKVWYPATATDSSAPIWATSIWSVSATTSDGTAEATATNTAQLIEMNTLPALDVTATIAYDQLSANSNSGASNKTAVVTNTGNIAGDTTVQSEANNLMCSDFATCVVNTFDSANLKHGLSDVTYASLTYTLAANGGADTVETELDKPTATETPVTDNTYWGIAIPAGQANDDYEGQVIFTPVAD